MTGRRGRHLKTRAATTGGTAQHHDLYRDVTDAIASLPAYFRTETRISGIMATDLHTLNTVLGASIEEQVVSTLNQMRTTWDPRDRYALYRFVRQAQTFPDVLLRRASDDDVLLGMELKGWYLLAKERAEPTLPSHRGRLRRARSDRRRPLGPGQRDPRFADRIRAVRHAREGGGQASQPSLAACQKDRLGHGHPCTR